MDNEPARDARPELYVVPPTGDPAPPVAAEFRDVPTSPLGLYVTRVDLPDPGNTVFIVVTGDGRASGLAALPVRTPEQSPLPAPGQPAPSVATPTVAEPGALTELCTRRPPCSMHDVSLDAALTEGHPVMLSFATPAYCQTAVCGPTVDVVDQVRQARDWGDVVWIHVEIYADAGQTLTQPVQTWRLPSEPWLYAIGRAGSIVARADGPLLVLPDFVTELAEQIE